jgi:hypothetical protein
MGIYVGIVPLEDLNMRTLFYGDENGGKSLIERDLRMETEFYPMPRRDSLSEYFIKITFINLHLNTLYFIFNYIFT